MRRFRLPAKNKYNATRKKIDGVNFASIKEADHYLKLKAAKAAGKLEYFLMQVPFHLPGGVKYVVDFQEHWIRDDGLVEIVHRDIKGVETAVFKIKKKQVEQIYGITIEN